MIPPYAGAAELAANQAPSGPPPATPFLTADDGVTPLFADDGFSTLGAL